MSALPPRERSIEAYLTRQLNTLRIPCLKFDPSNHDGMPDRLILMPDGRVIWAELKTTHGSLSSIQLLRHTQLRKLGHEVYTVWNKDDADALVSSVKTRLIPNHIETVT